MSTTELRTRPGLQIGAVLALAVVVVVPLAVLLREHGPGSMWAGFLIGAAIAFLGFGVALWRTQRHSARTTPADRALLHTGDERDDALLTQALAVVGVVAIPLTGLATIALAVGADTEMVMAILLITEVTVLVVGFAIFNRRS